jgi:hypothetical protein
MEGKIMYMTKKAAFTTFTLSTVGLTAYLLANKDKRKRMLDRIKQVYHQFQSSSNESKSDDNHRLITKIGHPDPHDEGDNKMVSEGAMYSVNYHNKQKQ